VTVVGEKTRKTRFIEPNLIPAAALGRMSLPLSFFESLKDPFF